MHIIDATVGGFLVPSLKQPLAPKTLNGSRAEQMYIIGMAVDENTKDYPEYCNYMSIQENVVKDRIQKMLS